VNTYLYLAIYCKGCDRGHRWTAKWKKMNKVRCGESMGSFHPFWLLFLPGTAVCSLVWKTSVLLECFLCRHDWLNHWPLIYGLNLQACQLAIHQWGGHWVGAEQFGWVIILLGWGKEFKTEGRKKYWRQTLRDYLFIVINGAEKGVGAGVAYKDKTHVK
jgi:hypothetical protein